jgi:hypothetical protein
MANSDDEEAERVSFASLPPVLQHAILRRLPVDARARCKMVTRGWNSMLTDVSLWTRLDLSRSSGVRKLVRDSGCCAAHGLAHGVLTALDVSGCLDITHEALLAVLTANADTLTELRVCNGASHELPYIEIEALLLAAPRLTALDADVVCDAGEQLLSMLRNGPHRGPMRVQHLYARCERLAPAEHDAAVIALAADIAAHDSLSSLNLGSAAALGTPAVLDAVVEAVLLRRLRCVQLSGCNLSPASTTPSLVRLLHESALKELHIRNHERQLLDVPAAALLADALRANSTLTTLLDRQCRLLA